VTLLKPMTSGIEAKGRFGKQDFRYVAEEDIYVCPAGQKLAYHYTNEENGLVLRRYWTNACQSCAIKQRCTTGKERRITRWEHEHVLEAVQKRLDRNPGHAPASRDGRTSHRNSETCSTLASHAASGLWCWSDKRKPLPSRCVTCWGDGGGRS
jgi:Transposase DDE domain